MEKTPELLCYIYKNVKMGSDAIVDLLPKVEDTNFRQALTEQLSGYETFADKAEKQLTPMGVKPREEPMMKKAMSKMGIAMNMMTDSSVGHMAEMLIKGSTMGITDMTKHVREFEGEGCPESALKLGRELITFEQNNIEKMKTFL
ncbi:MAG: hypothetical protein U0M06_00615 [Clostridia bacterium]|nr:hypothetical protein [Clostridia bacterium]